MRIAPVAEDQWDIVSWLWQLFRHDRLDPFPHDDGAGYLAWAIHPQTGEEAPIGFALVTRIGSGRPGMLAFHVLPGERRSGVGRALALDVIARHPGPWEIAFQPENTVAATFWRGIATAVWGEAWVETVEPIPGKPHLPPDHWIRSLP